MGQLNTRIVLRNDITSNYEAVKDDLVLLEGEAGIEFNPDLAGKVKIKIGDGTSTWAELPYFGEFDKDYIDEQLLKKANVSEVYKKEETYNIAEIETYVNNQINSVGHLKRRVVEILPLSSNADLDTIYMVKKLGGQVDRDVYEEYMIIDGIWELIGDTYVDLADYATKDEVKGKANKATTLEGYGITDAYTSAQVDDLIRQSGGNSSESVEIDTTLTVPGAAADAKATGDRIKVLEDDCYITQEGSVSEIIATGVWVSTNKTTGEVLNPVTNIEQTDAGVKQVNLWHGANNLFMTPEEATDLYNYYSNGLVSCDGQGIDMYVAADNVSFAIARPLIKCVNGDTFYFSSKIADYTGTQNPVQPLMTLYDKDGNVLTTGSGELYIPTYEAFLTAGNNFIINNENAAFARFGFRLKAGMSDFPATGDNVVRITDIMVSKGSAMSYEPYVGEEYTEDLGETVYGGSYDWTTGKLVITHDADGVLSIPRSVTCGQHNITAIEGTNNLFSIQGDTSLVAYGREEQKTSPKDAIAHIYSEIASLNAKLVGVSSFDPTRYNLPILALTGDISAMTKEVPVELNYIFGEREGTLTAKWQGNSSLKWSKKNYTLKFDEAFEAKKGWGAQKKYCAKANFIDCTHARNVVSAKLWGKVVKSRSVKNDRLHALPNGGAIDGYPIVITLNGEFLGLYTLNIPKDAWMFGMGTGEQEGIVCADQHVDATKFKAVATLNGDFELEYVTNEDDADWLLTSLNRMINAVINSDGTDLDTTVAQYLDWDSVIDYMIYAPLIGGIDMLDKNYILATYDGVKWFFSAYDMDTAYGIYWDGKSFISASDRRGINYYANLHQAMYLVKTYKADALKARFEKLTSDVLSVENVTAEFTNFMATIPEAIIKADAENWPDIPSTAVSNAEQISQWYQMRMTHISKELGIGENNGTSGTLIDTETGKAYKLAVVNGKLTLVSVEV